MDKNTVQTVADILTAAQKPYESNAAEPFVIIPQHHDVHSLLELQDKPRRIKDRLVFGRLDSFCEYVREFKLKGTQVFLNAITGAAKAVIDFHEAATTTLGEPTARWCDHTAEYQPLLSEEWKRWNAKNNQGFEQRAFALFLEDNAIDIVSPPAAEVLDVARTLTAKSMVHFKKGIRLDNGTEQLTYEEIVDAKAGQKGELEIPARFELGIPVFEGRPARHVEARLRYAIREGTVMFHYVLVRPHKIFQTEIDAISADITAGTEIPPLYGVDA